MKPNTYIGITILAGFVLIGYLYTQGGQAQIPGVIIAIAAFCKLFQIESKTDQAVAKVELTTAKVDRSISVSTENAHAIAAVAVQQSHAIEQVSQQVDTNTAITNTTHAAVNGQMSDFRKALEQVSAMKEEQSHVLAELVAARSELAVANARAGGITTGRGQAAATIAASDAARAGDV